MDLIIIFGTMFVAAVVIILLSVYISKIRKRQNKNPTADAESVDQSPPSDGTTSGDQGLKPTADQQPGFHDHKPSLWRKRVRTVLLRLRGQEQHKDVYIIPQHLRAQLKQMYVY